MAEDFTKSANPVWAFVKQPNKFGYDNNPRWTSVPAATVLSESSPVWDADQTPHDANSSTQHNPCGHWHSNEPIPETSRYLGCCTALMLDVSGVYGYMFEWATNKVIRIHLGEKRGVQELQLPITTDAGSTVVAKAMSIDLDSLYYAFVIGSVTTFFSVDLETFTIRISKAYGSALPLLSHSAEHFHNPRVDYNCANQDKVIWSYSNGNMIVMDADDLTVLDTVTPTGGNTCDIKIYKDIGNIDRIARITATVAGVGYHIQKMDMDLTELVDIVDAAAQWSPQNGLWQELTVKDVNTVIIYKRTNDAQPRFVSMTWAGVRASSKWYISGDPMFCTYDAVNDKLIGGFSKSDNTWGIMRATGAVVVDYFWYYPTHQISQICIDTMALNPVTSEVILLYNDDRYVEGTMRMLKIDVGSMIEDTETIVKVYNGGEWWPPEPPVMPPTPVPNPQPVPTLPPVSPPCSSNGGTLSQPKCIDRNATLAQYTEIIGYGHTKYYLTVEDTTSDYLRVECHSLDQQAQVLIIIQEDSIYNIDAHIAYVEDYYRQTNMWGRNKAFVLDGVRVAANWDGFPGGWAAILNSVAGKKYYFAIKTETNSNMGNARFYLYCT